MSAPYPPAPHGPSQHENDKTCAICKKLGSAANPLFRCSKCKKVSYCSKKCQKKAWKDHKKICKSPQDGAHRPPLEAFVGDSLVKTLAQMTLPLVQDQMSRWMGHHDLLFSALQSISIANRGDPPTDGKDAFTILLAEWRPTLTFWESKAFRVYDGIVLPKEEAWKMRNPDDPAPAERAALEAQIRNAEREGFKMVIIWIALTTDKNPFRGGYTWTARYKEPTRAERITLEKDMRSLGMGWVELAKAMTA